MEVAVEAPPVQMHDATAEIYARVFQVMRPRTPLPLIRVEFRRYANANAQIRWDDGTLLVRLADRVPESATVPMP